MNVIGISKRLVELRGTKSREEVAAALKISCSALSMYERGKRTPKDAIKVKIADYYGLTVQDIFFATS